MIVYGLLKGRKQIEEAETKQQGKFTEKLMVWLPVWSEGVAFLVLFEKDTLDYHQGSTVCCSSIRKQLDLPTRQQYSRYSARNARLVLPRFVDKDTWSPNN